MDISSLHLLNKWSSFFAAGAVIPLVLLFLVKPKRNTDEPPYIPPKVPIIGHLIGIATEYNAYYFNLLSVVSRVA
jgi:hypothetical protein